MASKLISNVASELIPKNTHRKSMIFQNEDTTLNIFIKQERSENTSVSTTDHDHRIGPGGLVALNFGTDGIQSIQGRWTVIAESGTPRISFFETEDIQR